MSPAAADHRISRMTAAAFALRKAGDYPKAVALFHQVTLLRPGDARAHYNLGCALHYAGRLEDAAAAYRRTLALAPDYHDAGANLGTALMALGRPAEALPHVQAEASHSPSSADAQIALSAVLAALGAAPEAIAAARRATALAPRDAGAWLQLAAASREGGDSDAAVAACRQALAIAPDDADALLALAVSLQEHGDTAAAREAAGKALTARPDSASAWTVLARLERFAHGDPRIAAMTRLAETLARAPGREDDSVQMAFALGKARMDAGEVDAGFAALAEANRRHRARIAYDAAADREALASIAKGLDAAAIARLSGQAESEARPVFIVGMPRSGTTLAEQILASHPEVRAGGEMKHLDLALYEAWGGPPPPEAWAERLHALDAGGLKALGQDYFRRAAASLPGTARPGQIFTDKMPSNFRHAGLIHLMFPKAVIVDCRRAPLDTCLSCFATHFTQGQHFTYDLAELGAYYRAYEEMMAHWRAVLPAERLIALDYEALVGDFETQARRLVTACGLPWHEACLAFHRTQRPVRTASVNQVRQPLYASSLGRARAYAHHLAPLGLG